MLTTVTDFFHIMYRPTTTDKLLTATIFKNSIWRTTTI